jgi:hypothetical protein
MNDEHDDDDNGVLFWRGTIIALALSSPFWYIGMILVGRFFTEVKW